MKYFPIFACLVLLCSVAEATHAQTTRSQSPAAQRLVGRIHAAERTGLQAPAHRTPGSASIEATSAFRLDSLQTTVFEPNGDTSNFTSYIYDLSGGFRPQSAYRLSTYRAFARFESTDYIHTTTYREYDRGTVTKVDRRRSTYLTLPGDKVYRANGTYLAGSDRYVPASKQFTKPLSPTVSTSTYYGYDKDGRPTGFGTSGITTSQDRDTVVITRVGWPDSTSQRTQPISTVSRAFLRDTPTEYTELKYLQFPEDEQEFRTDYAFVKGAQGRLLRGTITDISTYRGERRVRRDSYEYTYTTNTVTLHLIGTDSDFPRDTTKVLAITVTDPTLGERNMRAYLGFEEKPELLAITERVTFLDGLPLTLDFREYEVFDGDEFWYSERYYYSQVSGVTEARRAAEPCAADVTLAGGTVEATVATADTYALLDVTGRRLAEQRAGASERISFPSPPNGLYLLVGLESGCVSKVAVAK